ncbi:MULTISPECIES: hypothetical protein [unclassified Mesorhizobium]|uniref:hypothetical protein n=1 Tax=unclassified Mesorhizobium TaxID=325217 RepID=UPI0013DFF653|nr:MULTISPECIES: hypothetical protein [unclassified Mesorhizobium]
MLHRVDSQADEQPDVFALLRSTAESSKRLAESMLAAYAADALPATGDDIAHWERVLADAKSELLMLHDAHPDLKAKSDPPT